MNDLVPVNNIENTRKNKGGRPRGSINKRTELVQNLLSKDIPKIISVVRKAALDGSLDAAALILRYITPTPKGRRLSFEWPTGLGIAGISAAFDAVMQGLAACQLTVDEANSISAILEWQAKVLEADQLERRLEALEKLADTKHAIGQDA